LPKRRHGNLKNVQTVVKVFPEPALADQPGKIAVRRGNDSEEFVKNVFLCISQNMCGGIIIETCQFMRKLIKYYPF